MSYDPRFHTAHASIVDGDTRSPPAIAPGRSTLTSRLSPRHDAVQRRAVAVSGTDGVAHARAAMPDPASSAEEMDPLISGIHFCNVASVAGMVQRKEKAKPGGALSSHQLATARRANPAWCRRLRFSPAAFGGGDVASAGFAQAVAKVQAERGLHVDGIAGPATCEAVGAKPEAAAKSKAGAKPAVHAAPIAVDLANHVADSILGSDAGAAAAAHVDMPSDGHVDIQEAVTIDAPKEMDEERATLDPSHDYHADAAAESAPAKAAAHAAPIAKPSHLHTQNAVTIDAPKEIDESRDTLPIGPVQTRAAAPRATNDNDTHAIAAQGVSGAGSALPFLAELKASFGAHGHILDGFRAHTGPIAAQSSRAIGADAYATGTDIAFAVAPTRELVAHEAAHVVQQKSGIALSGGVGAAGDPYEQHADAVGAAFARGESVVELLSNGPGVAAGQSTSISAIQRKASGASKRIDRDARQHIALSYQSLNTQLAVGQKLQGRVAAGERPLAEIEAFHHATEYLKADLSHWADVLEGAHSPVALEWKEKTTKLTAKVDGVSTWLHGVLGPSATTPASPSGAATPNASPPTAPATPSPVTPSVAPVPPAGAPSTAAGTAASGAPKKPAATGYPEVDSDVCADPAMAASHGKVCDQPPVGRATLIGAVRADVEHGFSNFRDALSHAQLEIMLEKEKSWSPVIDFLILVMTFPLQPYAAAAYAAAKVEAVAISGKAIENAVKSGVALVSAELKAAAGRLPATRDGKVAFLQILKEKTDALATFMMHGAVSALDDRELPVFGHAFAAHNTLAGCSARVAEILARYDAQVASVGELRRPDGPLSAEVHAAARIQHNGKERVALIHSHDLKEWTFERWVDADMADMALKATARYEPGLLGPFSAEGGPAQTATTDMLSRPTTYFSPTVGLVTGVLEWDHTP